MKTEENAVPDPLSYTEPLPLVETFFPRGFPLVLHTNSCDAVAAAREAWGGFRPAFETEPVELRVLVQGNDDAPTPAPPKAPAFRAQGHLFTAILGPDDFAVCDLNRCFGFVRLTPAVARNCLFTSFYFLRSTVFMCLCHRYATPIHSACVARDGEGILLVGDSGAGKSSLAWACARDGLTFLADDCTWLLRNGEGPLLIGKPQRMRFSLDSLELIPDLARLPRYPTVAADAFEIRTADVPGLASASRCRASKVVFLDRRDEGPARFSAIGPEEAARRLAGTRPIFESSVRQEQEASLSPLISSGALVLTYSTLSSAVSEILKLQ